VVEEPTLRGVNPRLVRYSNHAHRAHLPTAPIPQPVLGAPRCGCGSGRRFPPPRWLTWGHHVGSFLTPFPCPTDCSVDPVATKTTAQHHADDHQNRHHRVHLPLRALGASGIPFAPCSGHSRWGQPVELGSRGPYRTGPSARESCKGGPSCPQRGRPATVGSPAAVLGVVAPCA
jgi:hypothetical protein